MIRNSTIIPKKRTLACGCFDFAFSKNMCKAHATIRDTNKRIAKHEEAEEDLSIQYLVQDLDAIFSQYIRLKYCDQKGMAVCFTSGKVMRWQELQCGHYISRSHYATRWLPENCRCQTEYDNCHLSGNLEVFRTNLEKENPGITEWLQEQARQVYKPTREELKSLIAEYRHKVSVLKTKIKV